MYPEDYFLRNFPWQQYGGLWIVNEARFARAEPISPLIAQSLRQITGVGASPQFGDSSSPVTYFTNSSLGHQPITPDDPQSNSWNPCLPIPALDGSVIGSLSTPNAGHSQPMFNVGAYSAAVPDLKVGRPNLTLLTDVGRRYPGFPSPLSPTTGARDLFPTPTSDFGSSIVTPRAQSPAVRSASPMSVESSNMCGPSMRCMSQSYGHVAQQMGNIDSILARGTCESQIRSPSHSRSTATLSPTSPQRALSPRVGMLRNMATKQAFRGMHGAVASQEVGTQTSPQASNVRQDRILSYTSPPSAFCLQSVRSLSPRSNQGRVAALSPFIQIANGTEFEIESPISSTGTVLSYTSNRAANSGLLAIQSLSEPQVAEYRFWVPCGRRACAFGCGGAHEGEDAAAKRLFKEAENVKEPQTADAGNGYSTEESNSPELESKALEQDLRRGCGSTMSPAKPVDEWRRFLMNRERDASVARI